MGTLDIDPKIMNNFYEAVKNVTKYLKMMDKGAVVGECAKSTPAHVKASIIHNQRYRQVRRYR